MKFDECDFCCLFSRPELVQHLTHRTRDSSGRLWWRVATPEPRVHGTGLAQGALASLVESNWPKW